MRLLRVHIVSAKTCGGLLDGLDLWLRSPFLVHSTFDPLCLIGPNGAGKSQFLQVLAEMFQSVFHACDDKEERVEGHPDLEFVLEYLIYAHDEESPVHMRISRQASGRHRPVLVIERKDKYEWTNCDLKAPETQRLLPRKIVGYTSGDNETLSLPFFISRSGYANDVGQRALSDADQGRAVPDTRLMMIDYATHLEVLVANLLLGNDEQRKSILQEANLRDLRSFRCVVQLAHSAAPRLNSPSRARKGIQLTEELEWYLECFQRCATCHHYDDKTETYIFDFWVNDQTRAAFQAFWADTLALYSSFHKLAMLNDLAIPKRTRERISRETKGRNFASRLPEPQDEDKVFRFERVTFTADPSGDEVDYVSLSDGEHQLAQLLGVFSMVSHSNVCFLLDEPESHFNPLWRVKFISRILDLPTRHGVRRTNKGSDGRVTGAASQECLLTTHAPFVPSDMPREKVFIFGKEEGKAVVRHPEIETYGTTFDNILEECFDVRPPISEVSRGYIQALMHSNNDEKIREGMDRLGYSVEKAFLADRLRQLTDKDTR